MNQNMMGMQMGQLPNLPTTKELWKNEKSKYRQWMILFAIGISVVFALLLTSAIFNTIGRSSIETAMIKAINDNTKLSNGGKLDRIKLVPRGVTVEHIIFPFIATAAVGIGLVLFVVTLFESYKQKNFGKLSGYTTFVMGLAAFYAFYSIIQMAWRGTGGTFNNPGGIFQFINYFLVIGIYFGGSMQVSRIRRTFIVSERIEKLKASQEYKQAQEQMNAMMNGQTPPMNPLASPYGPTMGTPTGTPQTNMAQPTAPVQPVISKERQELEKMNVAGLKKVAKKLSISGYSTMKKPELIKNILRVTSSN